MASERRCKIGFVGCCTTSGSFVMEVVAVAEMRKRRKICAGSSSWRAREVEGEERSKR